MGCISLTVLTSFSLLVAYSVLIGGADAKATGDPTQTANESSPNRLLPAVWVKPFPNRRLKTMNALSAYRRDFPPEVEFVDDAVNYIEKRFDDDYGHMR